MSVMMKEIEQLSVPEKIQLVHDIWDQIAEQPDQLPILEWQREELRKRELDAIENPSHEDDWDVVRQRLRAQL